MKIEEIREEIELFEEEVAREAYANRIGLKDDLNIAEIFEKYKKIFEKENIILIENKVKNTKDRLERRIYEHILYYLINGYLDLKVAKIQDEVETYEAKAFVKYKGKKINFRHLGVMIVNEKDKKIRDEMADLDVNIKKKLNSYYKTLLENDYRMLKNLQFKNYQHFYELVKEIDYKDLEKVLKKFLIDTDERFEKLMENLMKEINLDLKNTRNYDAAYYFQGKQFDKYFPKEKLMEVFSKTLLNLGFDIKNQKNIELDIEDRPKKVARAFCYPIKVPGEVKLVIKPHGGHDDYESILHESGHAEHYGNTNGKLPFELKMLGGNHSVSETYAFLFGFLLMNKEWLRYYIKMDEKTIDKFYRMSEGYKLFMFRRYCGKLIYELKLHNKDLRKINDKFEETNQKYKDMGECYKDILSKATKTIYNKKNYLVDVDDGFYSADYLRAWIMEAQLRSRLKEKFGSKWFLRKETGDSLRKLYSYGDSRKIDEIAKEIGYDWLKVKYLFDEFDEFLDKYS